MAPVQPAVKLSTTQTEDEEVGCHHSVCASPITLTHPQKNVAIVKEYMSLAYSPTENKGRSTVAHLCTSDSTFTAPTTFPTCKTPLDYADSHAKVMSSIADLHITSYDYVFAKNNMVLLRYSAEGSHCGEPHNGLQASGREEGELDGGSDIRTRGWEDQGVHEGVG
ncbi:MAG: hypothetical protein Q9195_001294 [Heterodermia aff. obscurata]